MATRAGLVAALLAVALVAATLAGCTASPGGNASDSLTANASGTSDAESSSPAPTVTAPPSTVTPSTVTPSTPNVTPPSSATAPTSPLATPTGQVVQCSSQTVSIQAVRGSGASQMQSAVLHVTNPTAAGCTLIGPPAVTLVLAGAVIATADPQAARSSFLLAAGATASATLSGPSSCNAPLSDSARVVLGADGFFTDVPVQLRGCTLDVGPFTAG